MKKETRVESDSMGPMDVPAAAYYGAQTARAVENFPISNRRFPRSFIRALGLIKKHAAIANATLNLLPRNIAAAIETAAGEVADGKWDAQFVVDIFQTGSGTSTNMNANEVIANRASELLGGKRGDRKVHPNDHVNRGQSSNDVIPSAIHLAVLCEIVNELMPALGELHRALADKASEFRDVIKIGRTHLQDATPMMLGQEFGGYASQFIYGFGCLRQVERRLAELPLGGTAVGTGQNAHPDFAGRVISSLGQEIKLTLRESGNHFAAQGGIDALVEASSALKSIAVSFIKIANDIRWLGSGPRCGLGEIKLPSTQPGSSIMPGKVNPVMCEMAMQACTQIIGNDTVVTLAGSFGNFELNTMLPLVASNLLESVELLSHASRVFARRCVVGLQADTERCQRNVENSLALCTALAPEIGYDRAAEIAQTAYACGQTVREAAARLSGLTAQRLDELLDPRKMMGPK